MNEALVERVARAVLYEGYILYPYRPSVKNRQRWTIGGIYPRSYCQARTGADSWALQAQVLVRGGEQAALGVKCRFLHLTARTVERASGDFERAASGEEFHPVESIEVEGQLFQAWQEAEERKIEPGEVAIGDLIAGPRRRHFAFPRQYQVQPLPDKDGRIVGRVTREQQAIEGCIELSVEKKRDQLFQVTLRLENQTPFDPEPSRSNNAGYRDDALLRSFASAHAIIEVRQGEFVSMTDPPPHLEELASGCQNIGCWPVLVGAEGEKGVMLASPIILPDYPQVAPESPGDLFDATEIDEILSLRVMTLTDAEKRAMISIDERAAALLGRTEALARDQLMALHGTVRPCPPGESENRDE